MISVGFWLLLFIPLAGSVIAYRSAKHRSLGLVSSLLLPPLVGELIFVYYSFQTSQQPLDLRDPSIWIAILYLYPFVMIPLGLWSPFVGLVAWLVLERFVWNREARFERSAPLGALLGAVVGAGLLGGFYTLLFLLGQSRESPSLWAMIGAASGATGGIIVALFLSRDSGLRGPRIRET